MTDEPQSSSQRIGFVSTRISGTDGVSLEVEKWAHVLEAMGHTCFYVAGQSDRPAERTFLIPEAHFTHPTIKQINRLCFEGGRRTLHLTAEIHETAWIIKQRLYDAIEKFKLDVVIAENCLTIPMNIPLGIALVETIVETGLGCIAHHHDFVWERERFLVNAVEDYIRFAFPPALATMQHVVINTKAARDFSRNTGLSCRVIPNVMNFDEPPAPVDDYASDFRETIGLTPDDILILQPTRIVPRKGIEHSIELIAQLKDPRAKLVITHAYGDEGDAYAQRVRRFADLMNVDVIFADRWISTKRGTTEDGAKQYTVWDAYPHADLVTYPSTYEGFGNAFLEALYYRKPILCNRYAIYRTDIEPCGFDVILMDGFLTDETVERTRRVLDDEALRTRMVEHNYEVATRYFSYRRLEAELQAILAKPQLDSMPAKLTR
ncbi:MAG: glycosyltransferase family 4 protein [Planctomycetes bacterium]|nr:glycosyltransferase family 4 protein [Planctomycetota bacterium]